MNPKLQSIAEYISSIRSYLAIDGGDLELVDLSPDGKRLYIRLLGSCQTCDLNSTTVRLGILEPLRRYFPSLEAVEIVS
ncbi:MAG: NifU family protein [Bacteroidia bacterium]|nr:NifU family protein [Bacteroidia bacterium]MCX7764759.1 NifU family protein [Bacteroidia bacterium]MDW8058367.1 NifU family protein [Bacteroidia bacterium]